MTSADGLPHYLTAFFSEHLPLRTGASRHTILAYRDAWKLWLRFVATRVGRAVPALRVADLDLDTALAFLDALEQDRHNAIATRNHRRTALQAFFRYLGSVAPEHLAHCQRILTIPIKRAPHPTVDYLERAEMDALLAHVDRRTRQGRRNYALLAFLYNSGARVQEALDLSASALQLDRPYHVRLVGKGRKERVCPLWPETAALLRGILADRGIARDAAAPVFVNAHGQPLTRYGVRYILRRAVSRASVAQPSLTRKRVHPHTLRHSCAVHLLQAGVELNLIRSWLGHVSLETTQRYAEIDLEQKRRALDAVTPVGTPGRGAAGAWSRNESILTWLEHL